MHILFVFQKPRIELNGIKEIPENGASVVVENKFKMEQFSGKHNAAFDTTVS